MKKAMLGVAMANALALEVDRATFGHSFELADGLRVAPERVQPVQVEPKGRASAPSPQEQERRRRQRRAARASRRGNRRS